MAVEEVLAAAAAVLEQEAAAVALNLEQQSQPAGPLATEAQALAVQQLPSPAVSPMAAQL